MPIDLAHGRVRPASARALAAPSPAAAPVTATTGPGGALRRERTRARWPSRPYGTHRTAAAVGVVVTVVTAVMVPPSCQSARRRPHRPFRRDSRSAREQPSLRVQPARDDDGDGNDGRRPGRAPLTTPSRRCSAAAPAATSAPPSSGSGSCCRGRAARSTGTWPATSPGRPSPRPATARSAPPSATPVARRHAPRRAVAGRATALRRRRHVGRSPWSRAEWVEATLPAWRELVDPVAGKVVDAMGRDARGRGRSRWASSAGSASHRSSCRPCRAGRTAAADDAQHGRGDVRRPDRSGARRRSRSRSSARPTSACRSPRPAGPRCCPPTSPPSAQGLECARRPGAALPRAARGRAPPAVRARAVAARRTWSTRSAPTRAASPSTPPSSRRRWAASTRRNPEALQEALTGGLFEPEDTPEQQAALARLETALALVEGWVDEVGRRGRDAAPARARRRCARRCAAGGRAADRPSRRSPRWSAWSCGRAGCATPPRCGRRSLAARAGRSRRGLGAPRPAADRRRPRRPGGLRAGRRLAHHWTCPGSTTPRHRRSPRHRQETADASAAGGTSDQRAHCTATPSGPRTLVGARRGPGAAAGDVPRAPAHATRTGCRAPACRRT